VTRAFLFAGGGTGGHLYPALGIHEQLELIEPGATVRYLCSDRPLDAELLGAEHVDFEPLQAKPIALRPRGLAGFLRSWGPSVRATRAAIRELKSAHDRVDLIAMGGFVAAPAAQAARVEHVPVTLVNLDAVPGKANRWIARRADAVVTAAPTDRDWRRVPPIVREKSICQEEPADCRRAFGLDPDTNTLLITGGSQGARSINELIRMLLAERREDFSGWQVIHQTGEGTDMQPDYERAGVRACTAPFIDQIGRAWRAADLAVSRAGAGSVADAWVSGTPTIFMPYPYHRDEHQKRNAEPLRAIGGAIVVDDLIEPVPNLTGAGRHIVGGMTDAHARSDMGVKLGELAPPDGARQVADMLIRAG